MDNRFIQIGGVTLLKIGGVILVLGIFLGIFMWQFGTPDNEIRELSFLGLTAKFGSKESFENHEARSKKIFENDLSKSIAENSLNKNQNMFSLSDDKFASKLQGLCEKSWEECMKNPNVKKLRKLAFKSEGPFVPFFDEVRVGVQDEKPHRPAKGEVNVCESGIYKDKFILLVKNKKKVNFRARGTYHCPKGGRDVYPDIQLNKDDAIKLFGTVKDTTVDAEAAILPCS